MLISKHSPLVYTRVKLWHLTLPLLAIANISYIPKDFFGWVITLGFFLIMPGYLLLSSLQHRMKSHWEIASFSLSLSLLIIMVGGLLLNSFHAFGLTRPLTTLNIFIMLDVITLALLVPNWHKSYKMSGLQLRTSAEQTIVAVALTLLPLLGIGGAIRLNNGASNILTMGLFASIPVLFLLLIWRKNLKPLYPYAIFMFGVAVLFSTSLRSWYVVGTDVHRELSVFKTTFNNALWSTGGSNQGNAYNACLSITILPTILAKITTIPLDYVYKVVFQLIFAAGIVPLFLFIKRSYSSRIALIGAFLFISFPLFITDMPSWNRQEIAFLFFSTLLLAAFANINHRSKTILVVLGLCGLILSHYSSAYVVLALLFLSRIVYGFLYKKQAHKDQSVPLTAKLSIILTALMLTFLWQAQITATSGGIEQTISQTLHSLVSRQASRSDDVGYSIFSINSQDPTKLLNQNAGNNVSYVQYFATPNLPLTKLGKTINSNVDVASFNSIIRAFAAKIFQVFLFLGIILLYVKQRKQKYVKPIDKYVLSLACSSAILLILITLLPQLSIDYGVTRFFQQLLLVTALPIVVAAEFLFSFMRSAKILTVAAFFALLFLHLSGFMPQVLGGYPPQLSLNNSGEYYNLYYTHKGEILSAKWTATVNDQPRLAIDRYAALKYEGYASPKQTVINPIPIHGSNSYLLQDYANLHDNIYGAYLGGDVFEYHYVVNNQDTNILYTNQDSRVLFSGS